MKLVIFDIDGTFKYDAVILDFDYTLADSSEGVIDSVNFALQALNLPTVAAERIRQTIGLSLLETFLTLVGQEHRDRFKKFSSLFVQRADQVMVEKTVLYESVSNTLKVLKRHGMSLGIVSTKFRYRIEAILQREKLLDLFDVIIGGEDIADHKPDPKGLLTAIERLGSSPARCLYVGDSMTDAETAKRASVPFVAVLSGVTTREDFKGCAVYRIIESLSELLVLIGL